MRLAHFYVFVGLLFFLGMGVGPVAAQDAVNPVSIAAALLDEDGDEAERRELAEAYPEKAPAILQELITNLESGTEEEARRIPWIWRVTINATPELEDEGVRELMDIGLPEIGEPLLNWHVVVIGGGIINAFSRENRWPDAEINRILDGYDQLAERWNRAIDESYDVAASPDLPYPWRYDALRMIALDVDEQRLPTLIAYLQPDRDEHLHMGAISGLSDIRTGDVAEPLVDAIPYVSERNRRLAVEALLRTKTRALALLEALDNDAISSDHLDEEHWESLREHESERVREKLEVVAKGRDKSY